MNRSIPKVPHTDGYTNKYRTSAIDALYKQKSTMLSKLKRLYRQFSDPNSQEIRTLKSLIKNLQKLIRDNYRSSINEAWKNKIQAIQASGSNMFPQINKTFRKKDHNDIPYLRVPWTPENCQAMLNSGLTLEHINSNEEVILVEDPQDKVNSIGACFEAVYRVNESTHPNTILENNAFQTYSSLRNQLCTWRNQNRSFTTFSENNRADSPRSNQNMNMFVSKDELTNILKSIKSKKSSGIDSIPNVVLKHLPPEVVKIYTTLFNNALNKAYYPTHWKTAIVHPIPKKGKDRTNPTNLRAISLLPNISKVFEKIINKALMNWCDENEIIPNNQFGFKAGHSTVHAASKLVSDIQWNKTKRQCTGACLVDFEKAFDTVWLEGLLHKLKNLRMPHYLLYNIYEMIMDKQFVVKCGDIFSSKTFKITNGLQQGAVNSPILFNIYTSDLVGTLNNAIAYADDIVVYRTGEKIDVINRLLQDDFNKIKRFCNDWKLKINFHKTETILFRTPLSRASQDTKYNWKNFSIVGNNNLPLQVKTVVRYLGIWLDQYLHFDKHIAVTLSAARNAFAATKSLFRSSILNPKVKIISYSAFIRPVLVYGCPIWYNISPFYMEKIRVFERQCLRSCLGLNRTPESRYQKFYPNKTLYDKSGLIRIDNFIIKIIRGHIARAMCSVNNLIAGAYYPNDMYLESTLQNGFIPPEAFLFLDGKGLIQDECGIPIIYHAFRGARDKRIVHNSDISNRPDRLRFSMAISERDKSIKDRGNPNWWWLQNEERTSRPQI